MMTRTLSLLALFSLTACLPGGIGDASDTEVLPDDRILINMPTDTAAKSDREWSEYYLLTASVTDDVNGLIRGVLHLVDDITDLPPSYVDGDHNHAMWGPYADALDPTDTALLVDYDPETDVYTWAFIQKPKGADDEEYVGVVSGMVDAGSTHEVNSGRFAIDFSMINELDPTNTATGQFVSEYSVDEEGVSASATFIEFSDGDDPVDAVYTYDQLHGGEGSMDVAWLADFTGGGADEVHIVRSRWLNDGQGRSDAYLTDGDLGEAVYQVSECWDSSFEAVYRTNSWDGAEEGSVDACAWAEAEWAEEAEAR